MVISNYTYLKLTMPRAHRVITVRSSFCHAYECELKSYELALETIAFEELVAIRQQMVKNAMTPKSRVGPLSPPRAPKEVIIDPNYTQGNVVRVSTSLLEKYESMLVDYLCANKVIFAWKLTDMSDILKEVVEHSLKVTPGSKPVKQHMRHFNEEKRRGD
jgi:hypothetical protein